MRLAALILFALGYVGLIAWALIWVRNNQRRHDARNTHSEGLGSVHFGDASISSGERDHGKF